ncbi:MAG: hypothetical protein ACK5UJ_05150, partial [Pseudobdellovibrionaceae bacterium]
EALRQERKMYLLILGELFKDVGARAGVLNEMISKAPNAAIRSQGVRGDSLMSALRYNNSLDLSALVNRSTLRTQVRVGWRQMDHNLVWQNQILNEFQKKFIDLCSKGLPNVANKMMTLGLIANSVSYREQHSTDDGFAKPRCLNPGATQTQSVGGVRRMLEGCQ